MSEQVSLAVKFVNENGYYAYLNTAYRPEALENLLSDTSFNQTTTFNSCFIVKGESETTKTIPFNNGQSILDVIYADTSLINLRSEDDFASQALIRNRIGGKVLDIEWTDAYEFNLKVAALANDDASISFYDNGIMKINIIHRASYFEVGTSAFNQVKNYIDSLDN
jgi:hypothetical protein